MIVTWRHQETHNRVVMPRLIHFFGHVMTSSSSHQFWSHDRLEKHHFGMELISGNFAKFDFRKKISFWIISNHFDRSWIRSDNRKINLKYSNMTKNYIHDLIKIFSLWNVIHWNFQSKITENFKILILNDIIVRITRIIIWWMLISAIWRNFQKWKIWKFSNFVLA